MCKNTLAQRYPGPEGIHLASATVTTLCGHYDERMSAHDSIHPRTKLHGEKLNTAAPRRKERGTNPYAVSMRKTRARGK